MAQSNVVRNIALLAGVTVIALAAFGSYVSAKNYGNQMEVQLDAKYQDNENVLSSGYQKVSGLVQVPTLATKQLKEVLNAAIQGRYGADGSKAVFQFIKEQNPTVDPSLYTKISQVIESSQDEFKNAQTGMLEIKRSYQTALGSFWQGFWLGVAGYPKLDLSKYRIISSAGAAEAFRTGQQPAFNFGQ